MSTPNKHNKRWVTVIHVEVATSAASEKEACKVFDNVADSLGNMFGDAPEWSAIRAHYDATMSISKHAGDKA